MHRNDTSATQWRNLAHTHLVRRGGEYFGICYNKDRLRNVVAAPSRWMIWQSKTDAAGGVADPTKSGSIGKAYEMIIQQKIQQAVAGRRITNDDITRLENAL